jgi:hypothetical protein
MFDAKALAELNFVVLRKYLHLPRILLLARGDVDVDYVVRQSCQLKPNWDLEAIWCLSCVECNVGLISLKMATYLVGRHKQDFQKIA